MATIKFVKKEPYQDRIWNHELPTAIRIVDKSNFDLNKVNAIAFYPPPIRNVDFRNALPENQFVIFCSSSEMQLILRDKMVWSTQFNFSDLDIDLDSIFKFRMGRGNLRIGNYSFGFVINNPVNLRCILIAPIISKFNTFSVSFLKYLSDIINESGWSNIPITEDASRKDLTVGTDPEFELLKDESIIAANHSFDNRAIGHDGSGYQLEIRPDPSRSPDDIIKQINSLLTTVAKKNYGIGIEGNYYPLGCHIHFGGSNFRPYPDATFVKLLDKWLYNNTVNLHGSARGRFKFPSQVRRKPWGFEYRSLPSGILLNPDLGRTVFKIALGLADKWYNYEQVTIEPSTDNYLEFINKEELKVFSSAAKVTSTADINKHFWAAWKIPLPIPDKWITILFLDSWKINWEIVTSFQGVGKCTICLYGFKSSRGNVYSIQNTSGFSRLRSGDLEKPLASFSNAMCNYLNDEDYCFIEHSHPKAREATDPTIFIGIPESIRSDSSESKKLINKVTFLINKYLVKANMLDSHGRNVIETPLRTGFSAFDPNSGTVVEASDRPIPRPFPADLERLRYLSHSTNNQDRADVIEARERIDGFGSSTNR